MRSSKIVDLLKKEYISLYRLLYEKKYIIEHKELSIKHTGRDSYELTWSGRNAEANITFDINLGIVPIINTLLRNEQFSMVFYDKSILQVEYKVTSNSIVKQRLQFIKKSNKVTKLEDVRDIENKYSGFKEIQDLEYEYSMVEESNWSDEESGIPVFLRIDYDPQNHIDLFHAKSHFVISNLKECRIPMKCNSSLSKFIELIIHQVYNDYSFKIPDTIVHKNEITENEKLVMHINW